MRLVALVTLASACGVPVSLTEHEHEIIGGTRSTGVTSTVLLASYPPDRSVLATCSAVVISPTVVLTVAHCVDAPNHPGYLYGVFTGDDASPYATAAELEPHLRPVASVHAHPQYSTEPPFVADIGVAVLAAPLDIAPAPLQRAPLGPSVIGEPAHILGYGQTVYEQPNLARHEATTTVVSLGPDTIEIGDAVRRPCLGDSGGPAFVGGLLVGVDSYGPIGCTSPAHYRRVDSYLPFIDQYVPPPAGPDAGTPPPPPAGDPDDGGCAAGGSPGLALAAVVLALARRRGRRS